MFITLHLGFISKFISKLKKIVIKKIESLVEKCIFILNLEIICLIQQQIHAQQVPPHGAAGVPIGPHPGSLLGFPGGGGNPPPHPLLKPADIHPPEHKNSLPDDRLVSNTLLLNHYN